MKKLIIALALGLAAPATADTLGPYTDLYVFGDSLSDPGNVFALSGGTNPSPDFYPDGQFTNGDTWAVQLGSGLGDNFAFGSARAVDNGDGIPDLFAQIDIFESLTPTVEGNPLTAIWIGGNDLRDIAFGGLSAEETGLRVGELATTIASGIGKLAQTGLDDFLVFLVPDISKIPAVVGTAFEAPLKGLVDATNGALQFALAQTAAALPINIEILDPNAIGVAIRDNPDSLGLTNVTGQCLSEDSFCGLDNASEYFFFDDLHPTEAVHTAFADAVRAQIVPLPGGMALALGGFALLGGLGLRRKRAA